MFDRQIGFDDPWYLLLLAGLPLLWIFSFRSLSGLGRFRRLFALAFRTLVFVGMVLALAEIKLLKTSEKMTVIYLLDQSESIPMTQRQAMLRYVEKEISKHRDADREDRAGVIVFGHAAVIEVPPFDDDIPFIGLESAVDLRRDATNFEAALKLAQASFPEDSAKRVVLVTDGNETLGDVRAVAPTLADNGIGIDVVPIRLSARAEVAVEKVALPSDIRIGQPFEARVVVNNFTQPTAENNGGRVKGKLKLFRQSGRTEELLNPDNQDRVLEPGKNVFSFNHEIVQSNVYTYRAVFAPDDPGDDLMVQNNIASAFTHVRGKGRILFIEDADTPGQFDHLIARLRANKLEIAVQSSNELFTSLAELQGFDCVVLADVPKSSGADANTVTSFSDEQISMLVRNTEQFGCGLVMLGGQNSFGAGGWANTELEKAMPVDFQIQNSKIRAVGALVLVMHASEMAQGNHWQKVISREAIGVLGPMDYCGMIHWGPGKEEWLWGAPNGLIRVGDQRKKMMARVDRMTPGDMPEFDPAMKMAVAAFNRVNASVKHMIMISDGDPSPPTFTTIGAFQKAKIQISAVAVGAHGQVGHQTLQNIANSTGGKYYAVNNPKALPRIFQIEARRVARPLIQDLPDVPPRIAYPHEMLQGIDEPLPPLKGFVMTTVKQNPLVEVAIRSPVPNEPTNSTILASWTYGMGRSVAFTTDAGHRWANAWTQWPNYDKFFSQMIRWAMRPVNEDGKFSVASEVKDGKVRVVVTALDKDDEFLNFLNLQSAAVDPDLKSFEVKIEQTAPGRYVGEFPADKAGSYFLTISPGAGKAPIMTGVNVPYSAEFRDRETNDALLKMLADVKPEGGQPGKVIAGDMTPEKLDGLLEENTFRHTLAKAISSQTVWPLFVLAAACVFFADVLVRRVQIHFYWIGPALGWVFARILRRPREEQPDVRMERLKSRKAVVSGELDERRAAARFAPQMDDAAPAKNLDQVVQEAGASGGPPPEKPAAKAAPMAADRDESYTSRLKEAKKQAWKEGPRQ